MLVLLSQLPLPQVLPRNKVTAPSPGPWSARVSLAPADPSEAATPPASLSPLPAHSAITNVFLRVQQSPSAWETGKDNQVLNPKALSCPTQEYLLCPDMAVGGISNSFLFTPKERWNFLPRATSLFAIDVGETFVTEKVKQASRNHRTFPSSSGTLNGFLPVSSLPPLGSIGSKTCQVLLWVRQTLLRLGMISVKLRHKAHGGGSAGWQQAASPARGLPSPFCAANDEQAQLSLVRWAPHVQPCPPLPRESSNAHSSSCSRRALSIACCCSTLSPWAESSFSCSSVFL